MTHLWESEHDYYCAGGNYHSNDWTFQYESWSEFLIEWGDADLDWNLLFRWDWTKNDETGTSRHELQMCYMLQRKGCYAACFVNVTPADEESVREFLKIRYEHLKGLWAPLE